MCLQELMLQGHIQAVGEKGQPPIPGLIYEGDIHTTIATQRQTAQIAKTTIIVSIHVNETSEWCNSFILVPKANGQVWLCLDPTRINKVLIRPVHRRPILNDILPRLPGIKYITSIDASLHYSNLKLKEQSYYFLLSIWQIQIHTTTIWFDTCW